jgi:Mn2+/Fe2+ NRAMP family transporter
MVLAYPLMSAIQEICAWIGRVTGAGIAANLKAVYPRSVCIAVIALIVSANVVNLAVDIAAMGNAAHVLIGGPAFFHALLFGFVVLAAEILVPYESFARILKWGTLVLFVYVAAAFTIPLPIREVLAGPSSLH